MEIYIHIPFCIRKCNYCSFYSIVNGNIDAYVDAICSEIATKKSNDEVQTIYFGGGTPSILTIAQLTKIFNALRNNFDLKKCSEITIEANPGTIDQSYLESINRIGINRLSLGVQTFNDKLLKNIGRIHNRQSAINAVEYAMKSFNNVNVDLMYGLPDQTMNDLIESINIVTSFNIKHISIYGLEIEEGTMFYKLSDKLNLPTEDECADMYDYIVNELPKRGFRRYEISNFAKKGFESRHNLGYWNDVKYLGIGAAAHSYDGIKRQSNVANVNEYIEGIKKHRDVSIIEEIITTQSAMEEFCFLSLRTTEGIDINKFKSKFNVDIEQIFGSVIHQLCLQNLIEFKNERVKLTEHGMKFGNVVFAEFLL